MRKQPDPDPEYSADVDALEVELKHPRGGKRFKYGILAQEGLPAPAELCQMIEGLLQYAAANQGGMAAKALKGRITGGDKDHGPDRRVLKESKELDRTIDGLHVELLRIFNRYGPVLVGQAWAGHGGSVERQGAAQRAQEERIKQMYPSHWLNHEVAVVEKCSVRWVRELRGSDRERG